MAERENEEYLLIVEDDKGRREVPLENSTYSIGREQSCDIKLASQFVSRRHATLVRRTQENGTYYRIVDGDAKGKSSANGLLINGRKVQAQDLQDEDEIIFGPNVRAIYYVLKPDSSTSGPPDEFDITLISPSMVNDPEEIN